MSKPWQPTLVADDADRAWKVIDAIAAELDEVTGDNRSLQSGHLPMALTYGYLARIRQDEQAADACADALERAVESIEQITSPWLDDGLAGLAWTLTHLADLVEIDDETFDTLDQHILGLVERPRWSGEWELLYGLVGLGVYGLERDGPAARDIRLHVVRHLSELAQRDGERIWWRSPPSFLSDDERTHNPDGYINLGLAHGMTGIMILLSATAAQPLAAELLTGLVAYYQSVDRGDATGRFPLRIGSNLGHRHQLDGWCYGDQAIGLALVLAGQALDRTDMFDYGIDVARSVIGRAAGRPLTGTFCHGTLGRAHLFNRLGQMTGDQQMLQEARRFYLRTLDYQVPGRGIGGFEPSDPSGSPLGILEGAPGIALGLMAAASATAPSWDRHLLCSRPENTETRG